MVLERTRDKRALTICRDTESGMDSLYAAVMVCVTRSASDIGAAPVVDAAVPGEGGGETADISCCRAGLTVSAKKEYDINFWMQSKLAIISFSFLVSQASLKGSKISLGRSPPWPFRIISNAAVALSLS